MNLHEELAAKDALITAQVVRIAELERENARLDAALDGEISCRDHYHEWADKLAAEISRYFGVDIGEHSNANNPWEQAYEAVPAAPAVEQPIGHISKGMLEQLRERLGVSGYVQSGRTEEFPVALYTAPQAAEAAKATGTAGDLPPLPERDGDWAGDDWFTKDTLREYGQACAEAVLCAPDGESWQHKFEETDRALLYWKAKAKQAEAALQPEAAAPVTIPKVEIELPAGDPRKVKIHLDTITDGVRWLCCTIESPAAQDLSAAIRLRLVCKLLGLGDAVPKDDAELWGCAFSVLGMIRAKLEEKKPIGYVVQHDASGGNFFAGTSSFDGMRKTYGRAAKLVYGVPVNNLSDAILALPCKAEGSTLPLQQHYASGFMAALEAAAALASSANALSAGDRVDAEPFDIAPAEVRKVMRAPLAHGAWIERTGPLDLWALYNEHGFVRMLHRFEIEFVDGAIAAAILQSQKAK